MVMGQTGEAKWTLVPLAVFHLVTGGQVSLGNPSAQANGFRGRCPRKVRMGPRGTGFPGEVMLSDI